MLETIDEAYSILSDREKRRLYDEARGIIHSPTRHLSGHSTIPNKETEKRHEQNSPSIQKTLAKSIFSLDYEKNNDMEQRIEQQQLFDGVFLKEIREYKNVNLIRMAEMTKVSKTYLRYIEEENFDSLPASVYVRGFVYQYAKSLKLNPELVANSFLTHMKKARES
jgi:curved DNA-binding protein CbpA